MTIVRWQNHCKATTSEKLLIKKGKKMRNPGREREKRDNTNTTGPTDDKNELRRWRVDFGNLGLNGLSLLFFHCMGKSSSSSNWSSHFTWIWNLDWTIPKSVERWKYKIWVFQKFFLGAVDWDWEIVKWSQGKLKSHESESESEREWLCVCDYVANVWRGKKTLQTVMDLFRR